MPSSNSNHALPNGFDLMWYQITDVLGQGGFAYTYLAIDKNLNQHVAVKEFMPTEFVFRDADNTTVRPQSKDKQELFEWGLERFRIEARTLAQFKHPNIVRVLSVFEKNNTAYMVMEYEQGDALDDLLAQKVVFDESKLKNIVLPILDGLQRIHETGFIHRDIKPGNIYIRSDETPVLLDFGSARNLIEGNTRSMTSLVTPGYAPFEQYSVDRSKQGPWTDIYSFGATLYFAITGKNPADAMQRANAAMDNNTDPYDPIVKCANKENFSLAFLEAVDAALNFKADDRPQSVRDWANMLAGDKTALPLVSDDSTLSDMDDRTRIHPRTRRQKKGNQNPTLINAATLERLGGESSSLRRLIVKIKPYTAVIALSLVFFTAVAGVYIYLPFFFDSKKPSEPNAEAQENAYTVKDEPERGVRAAVQSLTIDRILINESRDAKIAMLMKTVDAISNDSTLSDESKWKEKYQLYQELLSLSPQYLPAKNGIKDIHLTLETRARKTISANDFEQARDLTMILSEVDASKKLTTQLENERVAAKRQHEQRLSVKKKEIENATRLQAQTTPKIAVTTSVKEVRPDMQGAIDAIAAFKKAIEARDHSALFEIAVLSPEQDKFLSELLTQYQIIRVRVSDVEFVKLRNQAKATVTIRRLVNADGDVFKLSGGKEALKITTKFSTVSGWRVHL